jgi:hypothetical protein
MRHLPMFLAVLGVTAGCANGIQPDEGRRVSGKLSADPISGYKHSFDKSLVKLGSISSRISDQGFSKVIGSDGVFAVDEINGFAESVPNPEAIARRPPYPGTAADHHARTAQYFLIAGLPSDQIGVIQVHTAMRGGQSVTGQRTPDQFLGYYSIIGRQILGVPVSESFAWARFNVDGDVVEEAVFWPELPGQLKTDVQSFLDVTANVDRSDALKANIEKGAPGHGKAPGRIVIHHQNATDRAAPFSRVLYDVTLPGERQRTRRFDMSGAEVVLRSRPLIPASAISNKGR